MNSRLEEIKEASALAKSVQYNAKELAIKWHLSLRQLERYFQTELGCTPYRWLRELRMKRAVLLIAENRPIKEVAEELCYGKYPEHFARDFKDYFGESPRNYRLTALPDIIRRRILFGNS